MGFVAGFMNAEEGEPSYDAGSMRMIETASMMPWAADPVGVRTGVRPSRIPAYQVTIPQEGTYAISPGIAIISKSDVAAPGGYFVVSDETTEGAIQDRDATYPRIDAVFLRVNDADHDTSENKNVELGYEAGVPAAAPIPPEGYEDANDDTLLLAYIAVPQVGAGDVKVTDKRRYTVSSGGVLPVDKAPSATSCYPGQMMYRRDLKTISFTDGASWFPFPKMKHGTAKVVIAKGQVSGTKNISFPSGYFRTEPKVVCSTATSNSTIYFRCGTGASTKDGATFVAVQRAGNAVSDRSEITVDWVALSDS